MANTTPKLQRQTKDPKVFLQDDENTMTYNPRTMWQNKFFGQWGKVLTIVDQMNHELKDKYLNDYQAYMKANSEIGSVTVCFDKCI